jgi:hypothetical protein
MKTLHSGLTAAVLAAAFVVPGTFPTNRATAAPLFIPKMAAAQSNVIQVRDGWYRGQRGYRYYRRGYRNYNGWWYPAGAFVAGALIGGAIANSNYYGGGYYGGGYYNNNYYGGGYYPRYYQPRYYAPAYYPPRGTAYRQGYRDGFRDGANARYYGDITCTTRLADAGAC